MVTMMKRIMLIPIVCLLLLVACLPAEETAPVATQTPPTETAVPPTLPAPEVVVSRPEVDPTTQAESSAPPTATPGPTPTAGPLNEPVPLVPKGGESCEDYPCFDDVAGWEARIQVPPGFRAEYVALLEGKPTSLAFGPDGLLYVALQEGQIVTVDADGTVMPYIEGLYVPVALAFAPDTGRLFVSSRVSNSEAQVSVVDGAEITPILTGVPCCYAGMHAANGLAFGPDRDLYLAVGARADHGEVLNSEVQDELHPWEASVIRLGRDGTVLDVYARGLRNAYDIAWDANGRLFASDNGPDYGPPDEFHLVQPGGEHGYPWYDCDHCFPVPAGVEVIPPLQDLIAHGAPTGMTVYLAEQFPGYYNNIFLTLWSAFEGAQKVIRFSPGGAEMTDFATGFAAPIDVTVGPEGSLYVADWATGVLFRIVYNGE
jgi:glucose/arabinose dehydrogenase